MPSQRDNGFSFVGMVVGVMTLLKLKGKYDEYKQTSTEEEGRVALNSPSVENLGGEGGIALNENDVPVSMRRPKKKSGCCVCCGMDCSLFWKAVGIVLAGFALFYTVKAIKWALTDAPTGLEGMPAFGTSLGCADAAHIYNGSEVTMMIPIGENGASTALDMRGGSVGTILIADGDADATEVKYTMTLRTSKEALLEKVQMAFPEKGTDGTVHRSRLIVDTPHMDAGECMRYDVQVFLPPKLERIHIMARTLAHVGFTPGTTADRLEQLLVTLFEVNSHNILRLDEKVIAKTQQYNVYRGYVVGEASITDELSIETQRGDAVANVKVRPAPPTDPEHPAPVTLRTVSGGGRSDITYLGSKAFTRNLSAMHTASKNADMYLTYRGADVNGKIDLQSKSYTLTGAQSLKEQVAEGEVAWTHFVGNKDGGDEIRVDSRGWTGLYF